MDAADAEARRTRFEEIAPAIIEPLRRFLARRTDRATAQDVLSDTLLVCWRRLDEIPDEALPWAYGVARHCLANAERGSRRQQRVAAKVSTVDPPREVAPEPTPSDERVTAALAAMRPEDAELLRLWAWEQLTPAEIATVLAITSNAASIRLHRAREKFRDQIRKIEDGGGHEGSREGGRP